jgi:amino acid permease
MFLKVESEVQYQPLAKGDDLPMRRKSSGLNLVGIGCEYLTEQVMPQTDSNKLPRVESYDLLRKNTLLHNTSSDSKVSDSRILKPLAPTSLRSCVITLVATALGSGVLALPYAFAHVGLVAGLVALTVAACFSCLSLVILMLAGRYTEANSYAALLTLASGSSKAGLFLDGILVIYGCATILALLIFEGDFVPAILGAFGVHVNRTVAIMGTALCVWPLVLPSKVSALRYVAALSPFAILYIAANVFIQAESRGDQHDLQMCIMKPAQILETLSIFVFSVMCHTNAVPVVHMLERPSVARIVKVATYSNFCCWGLYLLIGVGGYISFHSAVQGDFLLNYPNDRVSILVCRMMMSVVCYVGIPMNSSNAAQALLKLVSAATQRDPEAQVEQRPLVFALLSTVLLVVAAVAAIFLTNVADVISVLGGSMISVQMFWIPVYIYWKLLYPSQPPGFRKCVSVAMVIAGIAGFASVFATVISKAM